ncbi:hypothetical protein [Sebaldella sp. S0638]|uniref:hypothetical protein n=1 Tax=Sebaldella sp. S0638 TaxID=2957809 RepID=UPI00209C9C1E|nr:hypothetical protein [Sebaldella sp. S0638]MCP1225813.1 hypothetical protein [Sebaldella sp. S0638]
MNNRQYWIYVPLTKEDQEKLYYAIDYNEVRDKSKYLLMTEDEMNYLWNKGLFHLINNVANVIIDEYEEEVIDNVEDMKKVLEAINRHDEFNDEYSTQIKKLFQEAIERETEINFAF